VFFNGPQGFYRGDLDEVRIWNIARDPKEIVATMHRPLSGAEPGLVGYWKFDEGSGQNVADSSPSGVTGVLGRTSALETSDPTWVESSAPLGPFIQGILNAASFRGDAIAPGQIISLFGFGLADETAEAAERPLPVKLGGTEVKVIDSLRNEH
jgi:hypothetical protein